MKTVELDKSDVAALERLAHVSKMDCWFRIDGEGNTYDLESDNPNKPKNNIRMIMQLVEGATKYDVCELTDDECYDIINIMLKIAKARNC